MPDKRTGGPAIQVAAGFQGAAGTVKARRSDRGREEPLLSRRLMTADNRRVRSVWQSDSAARETAALSVTAEGHAHTRPPSCGTRPRSEEHPYAIFKRRSDLAGRRLDPAFRRKGSQKQRDEGGRRSAQLLVQGTDSPYRRRRRGYRPPQWDAAATRSTAHAPTTPVRPRADTWKGVTWPEAKVRHKTGSTPAPPNFTYAP